MQNCSISTTDIAVHRPHKRGRQIAIGKTATLSNRASKRSSPCAFGGMREKQSLTRRRKGPRGIAVKLALRKGLMKYDEFEVERAALVDAMRLAGLDPEIFLGETF